MDTDLFLRYLRDHAIEEGRSYIQEHLADLSDSKATGELLADEALRVLYTPFLSLKIAELLIFYGEITGDVYSHALGLKGKGDALFQIGHHEAALECLDSAGATFLSLEDRSNWASSRITWVLSAGSLGWIEDALRAAEQARAVFLQLDKLYWAAVIDNNTAMVYEFVGRYQDALKLYERMLTIFSSVSNQSEEALKRSIAITQVNLARNLSWLGNLERACRLLLEAQASFAALGEMALVYSVEIDLADIEYTQGYFGSALRRYYQAREGMIHGNVDNPVLLAELKLCMANCLIKLNRWQEASQLSGEAVQVYRESGESLSTGNALREHAATLVASKRLKEALQILDEAWILFNRGGFEPHAMATKLQQAEILLEMKAAKEAFGQAEQVKAYCDTHRLVARSIRASLIMASSLIEKVRQTHGEERQAAFLREAEQICRKTILQARQHNLQEEIYKSHYLLGQVYAIEENLSRAAKHYGAAIMQIERILDNLIYDLSPSFLHTAWSVYDDMIALCLRQSQVEQAFCYLEQARSIALRQHLNYAPAGKLKLDAQTHATSASVLRTQRDLRDWQEEHRRYSMLLADIDTSLSPTLDRNIIQAELKRCEMKLNELFERLYLYEAATLPQSFFVKKNRVPDNADFKIRRIQLEQVQQYLSSDHLLLAYYLHKNKLIIFAITSDQVIMHEQPEGVEQLEYLLPLFHAHLRPASWPDPAAPPQQTIRRLLKKLYDLLIAPVASLLPAQSGSLTIVPYGSLHKLPFHALYDGSHFLVEDFQVNYLPTSSLLLHLANTNQQAENGAATNPPLVFGYSEKGHLQRVLDEAQSIASLLEANCYLEKEATIERLIQQASGCPVIHLATHGKSRLDAPNFSFVRLADGQLNALDAFRINLKGCELVTLSGCETGLALSGGGDEQLGLGRAFLAAGATSLVMSLWPVEDNATNILMKLFYQQLLEGKSKVEALRTAQGTLLQRHESAHPYFWAAFRLVGDGSPLKYRG